MVWYSHLFQNFPQFIVIHTAKGFGIVNKAEIDVFLLYFALVPANDEECEEYVILRVSEDGEDIILESIDDDDEFEKVEEYFNDLLFGEIDYDEE